jgi:cytosine/adenosine deaminase-related metal-dependent hydrolase
MADLVLTDATLIVPAWGERPIVGGWVAVSDGRVKAIGRGTPPRTAATLDCRDGLVIPGAVSAHHHLFQGASRGVPAPGGLLDWLTVHYRAWARLTEPDVEAAATLSLALLALGGATTVAAFEYLHPADADFVAPVVRAAERVGLRLLYVRGSAPRLEGPLAERLAGEGVAVDRLIEPEDRALAGTAATLARPTTDRLRWACGPTTPVLDDDGAFHHALTAIADAHDAPIHTHFHPISGSMRDGETPADLAARAGLLRRGNWFAHGSRLSPDDVRALGAAGVGVVHAPSCSLVLGYPVVPLRRWTAGNDRVAIAVDGAASNDRGSTLLEAQLAWQLQRAVHGPAGEALDAAEVLRLTTEGGARAIGWPGLGRLAVGGPADLAVIDLAALDLAGVPAIAHEDPATMLFRTYAGGRVRHLLTGERVVVRDGRLTGVDEATVARAANAAADRLYGPTGDAPTRR